MKKIKLEDINKETIFQTPPDYFEDLPSIIQARAIQSKPQAWYVSAWKQPVVKFALPAMLIILAVVFRGAIFPSGNDIEDATAAELMEELSTEEMYAYLIEHTDVTHEDLYHAISENQLDLGDQDGQLPIDEEYLEDIDIEDLEELL